MPDDEHTVELMVMNVYASWTVTDERLNSIGFLMSKILGVVETG
jgi:hypothetical protein